MSDKEENAPIASPADVPAASDTAKTETASAASVEDPKAEDETAAPAVKEEEKPEVDMKATESELAKEEDTKPADESSEKPTKIEPANTENTDIEMTDAPDATAPAEGTSKDEKSGETEAAASTSATPKTKTPSRRKSTAADNKGKTLNKKASKAQILHTDAKPGDHYFIKLKGHPQWPIIICAEDMLPQALLKSRPVSAARATGEYREDFAEGGKNVANRTFPIMYLATNEFGWVSNKDLKDLDHSTVAEQYPKGKKDLVLAHQLAAENHDIEYYRDLLAQFQEEQLEKAKAVEAKAAAAAVAKSKKKGKVAADDDIEMEDFSDEAGAKKDKKRKNPDDLETPQRAESVKKPKIKLINNSTPKSNGASSKANKSGGDSKASKKAKKPKEDSEERVQTPAAPELSAGEKYDRKKKEVLFLRHKLQKGLLTRDQQPKEDEMKMMSDYLAKLEGFADLETDIIRVTKINKVLKAMLKLDTIPKEEEFEFKPRSQVLLDKWNRLLASDQVVPQSPPHFKIPSADDETKSDFKLPSNGVKKAAAEEAEATKIEVAEAEAEAEGSKGVSKKEESPSDENLAAKTEEVSINDEKPKTEEDTKVSNDVDGTA